jgi:hypothetical protein
MAVPNAEMKCCMERNIVCGGEGSPWRFRVWYRTSETRCGGIVFYFGTQISDYITSARSVPAQRVLCHHGSRDLLRACRVASAGATSPTISIVA